MRRRPTVARTLLALTCLGGAALHAPALHALALPGPALRDPALHAPVLHVPALPGPALRVPVLHAPASRAPAPRAPVSRASLPGSPAGGSGYHSYAETVAEAGRIVAAHPGIARSAVYGTSYEGRDLIAVKISDNVAVDEDEPEVLFTHHQHAREHLTVEMALHLLHLLTEGYGRDKRITGLVDGHEIWIMPDLNPDGGEYDLAGGSRRGWRKNRQPAPGSSAVGTDLNRNWPYRWGCCGGSSGSPAAQTYRGPASESAPEVRAVADWVRGRVVDGVQQIRAHIDWHSYGEMIMWPYGHTRADTAPGLTRDDRAAYAALGRSMAAVNGYTPRQAGDRYVMDGTLGDWMWGTFKIFSYTFEMYPARGAPGFYPPGRRITAQTARNREAVLRFLEYSGCVYRIIGRAARYCGAGEGPAAAPGRRPAPA